MPYNEREEDVVLHTANPNVIYTPLYDNPILKDTYKHLSHREIYIELDKLPNLIIGVTKNNILYNLKDYIRELIINDLKIIEKGINKVHLIYYNWIGDSTFNLKEKINVENGKINYTTDDVSIDELQKDIDNNSSNLFKYSSNYKLNVLAESIPIFNELFNEIGIEWDFIYEPIGLLPFYTLNDNILKSGNINTDYIINSLSIYGLDFDSFKKIYGREFDLIDRNLKNIDIYTHKEEIEWLSSLLYEDCYSVKNIIKSINPTIDFGLGMDFYITMGNKPIKSLDNYNYYSDFQREIMFNENLMYPFADFLFVDRINYDILIGDIIKDENNKNHYIPSDKIDTRNINERVTEIAKKFNYPLDKTSISIILSDKGLSVNDFIGEDFNYKNIYDRNSRSYLDKYDNNIYSQFSIMSYINNIYIKSTGIGLVEKTYKRFTNLQKNDIYNGFLIFPDKKY